MKFRHSLLTAIWGAAAFGTLCLSASLFAEEPTALDAPFNPANIEKRGDYFNSQLIFERTKTGVVAFLGGSITEMDGYRPMMKRYLQERFPETEFIWTEAGLSSTCSTTGAFRFDRDILSHGAPDLLFVEFAVNDDQDAHHSQEESIRGMEGLIRQLRMTNPNADIVMVYFVNEGIMAAYRQGGEMDSIQAHRKVAEHYGVGSINLAKEVTEEIDGGPLTWEKFGGVHPAPFGNRIAASMAASLLASDWDKISPIAFPQAKPLPEPLDPYSYAPAGFLSPENAKTDADWKWAVPDWPSIPGTFRDNFAGQPLLCAEKPGAKAALHFSGKVIGAFILAGPDAGILEWTIDGKKSGSTDLFHAYSEGLHYPRTVIFDDQLDEGEHCIEMTISADKNAKSRGTAARILQFCVEKTN